MGILVVLNTFQVEEKESRTLTVRLPSILH